MKKYKLIVLAVSLTALAFPKDITPVFSVRYDSMDEAVEISNGIGLQTRCLSLRTRGDLSIARIKL